MITAFGCTTAKHPAWVSNGLHPEYPPGQFLVGVGLSSRSRDIQADLQKADTYARLEVAKQLKVKIQSNMTSRKEQKNRSRLPKTYTSKTILNIKEDVELLLRGITIVNRYYSKKDNLHYSMAVLNKFETAKRLSSEITRHSHNVRELSRQSDILLKNGDIIGSLYKKIKAVDHYRDYIDKKQKVAILNPYVSGNAEAPPDDPYDGLIELKNKINLISLDGDMQAGRTGRALDRPLRIKAIYNQETPIDHLPVIARYQDQAGRTEQNSVTGKDGKAEINVFEIPKTDKHINLIPVSVDWDRIIKEALEETSDKSWDDFLSGPSVHFKYRLRVPNASHVLIKICNQSSYPNVDATSILHPASVNLMRKKGFLIKKTGWEKSDRTICSGALGIQSIVRKYRRATDIVVIEKIDVDVSSRRGQGYVFRAKMSITAYDMVYHEIMASIEGEALGGANNRKKAVERAIREVGNELIPRMASLIAEGL